MQDGVVEEDTVLGDDGQRLSQAVHRHFADVPVADEDATVRGVVEAVQQSHDGGFPVERRGEERGEENEEEEAEERREKEKGHFSVPHLNVHTYIP